MPETKVFLDTNVIIYAYDVSAKRLRNINLPKMGDIPTFVCLA
mgnify:CR=1 FL=1